MKELPATPGLDPKYQLNLDKLHSLSTDQQSLYLLTFYSDLESHLEALPSETITEQQTQIKAELLRITPTRVVRNIIGRCYKILYTKGNKRTLHEAIEELLTVKEPGKHAAVYYLGVIFETAGDSAINLAFSTCTALLKLLKSANDTGLRAAIFKAIRIPTEEDLTRSIYKQARGHITDKSYLVSINATRCVEYLVQTTTYFDNVNDFEKLQTTILKAMDSSPSVRRAAASLYATILVKNHTLLEALRLLGINYTKSTTTNRMRAALIITMIKVIPVDIEENYNTIAQYLLVDLLGHASLPHNKHRLLMTRKYVSIVLDSIRLGEAAQLDACRYLLTLRTPNQTVIGALNALTTLLNRLQGAAISISDTIKDTLLEIQTPANQQYISQALQAHVLACPHQILPALTIYRERTITHAYGLQAILNASAKQPLYGSVEIYASIMSEATSLLKTSAGSDLYTSASQVQVAWIMISGLMQLGPNFVKVHLQQLLQLWKNALPKPIKGGSLLELSFLAHVRECALSSIRAFLIHNSRLLTSDVSKRIASMLEASVAFINLLPDKKSSDDPATRLTPTLHLQDYETMVTSRILQCFTSLLEHNSSMDPSVFSVILPLTVRPFSLEYEQTFSATIISESIWEGDYGLTSLTNQYDHTLNSIEDQVDRVRCSETEVIDAAIEAFAIALPLQTARVQETILEQISDTLTSKDTSRKAAISINIAYALRLSVDHGKAPDEALLELLHSLICNPDETVRFHAGYALGKLSNGISTAQVTWLTDTIINNRDPNVRAGCAHALACIYSQLGGMAAGLHIKDITAILTSLSADSHPVVHYWAINSLASVADSAGLNFLAHVNSTIGLLTQLYISDDHNAETESQASSNMLVEYPVTAAIVHGIAALINVLGPDLQDMTKARDMITTLTEQFLHETEPTTILANLKCRDYLNLYAPNYFPTEPYLKLLQSHSQVDVQQASYDSLCNLMRRDTVQIIQLAPDLEDHLWEALDDDIHNESIRKIFINWLQQTATADPEDWISRCSTILTKTKGPPPIIVKEEVQDEEVAGFGITTKTQTQELLRWQVRLFAMECLYTLISTENQSAIQQRIAEVIRIAFSASTANVAALRVIGLRIIEQILKIFGKIPDPDFGEAMLLEQYQAQISSALTPAFAADSTPVLAAEAITVCATFISTGIVTDIDRMGRTLKILVSALDSEVGELKDLSTNAQIMIRMSVYSAWAEIQVASIEQKYLADVVKPHITKLVPLWLNSLREYARLRFEPEISAATDNLAYAAFDRQTLLKFYSDSWLSLVDAIASLIDADSQVVYDAMDGKSRGIDYRDEPVAFFFVLFGLAFEALAIHDDDQRRKIEILQALKKILRPTVSGDAIYQDSIFEETIDLMHRMVLTESLGVQSVIVEIATNLCISHPSSRQSGDLSEDIEQLFELTRIMVLVLAGIIPGLSDTPVTRLEPEAVTLVHSALQALVDISEVFPTIIRTDLRDAILHIFVVILGTGSCQAVIVPQALPMFRRLVASMAAEPLPHTEKQLTNALNRMLSILQYAQRRETDSGIACEKNTLLASALLIGAASDQLSPDSIQRFVVELIDCLHSQMTIRVAVGCIRTLLIAGVEMRTLLQAAIDFLLETSELEGVGECKTLIAQTLIVVVSRSSVKQKPAMLNLVLSTFLQQAESEGGDSYSAAAVHILELSKCDAGAFRSIVAGQDSHKKSLLESILRKSAEMNQAQVDEDHEPTIALKLNF